MSQKIRQNKILSILNDQGYVTVRYLIDVLQYSSATVSRDPNARQTLKLVKRTRGGVELYRQLTDLPPLPLREFYQKNEKIKIAKEASKLISDGDSIFLSGSTTVMHMIPFLAAKKDLTVITNSLRMCQMLGEFDFEVICLGGRIKERPHILMSDMTIENAMRFHVDKMFFSTKCNTLDGIIVNNKYLLYSVMMKNSKQIYMLTDKSKLVERVEYSLCDFSALSGVIADFDFPEEVKQSYPNVKFIFAKE